MPKITFEICKALNNLENESKDIDLSKKKDCCEMCASVGGERVEIGNLRIFGMEGRHIILKNTLQMHLIKQSRSILGTPTLCTRCHFYYHYHSKLSPKAIENWELDCKNKK